MATRRTEDCTAHGPVLSMHDPAHFRVPATAVRHTPDAVNPLAELTTKPTGSPVAAENG
jgi:hypothetical protein